MKKIIFVVLICYVSLTAQAQQTDRFTFATSIGIGFPLNKPGKTPFTWQIFGNYSIAKRVSIGIGTGLFMYEKALIPLLANAKFTIINPKKLTPYLEWAAGYSFAPEKNTQGGFYLNPSIGLQCSICENKKIFFALGYELQQLERLKTQVRPSFTVEFEEKLNHNSISIKIGYMF